MNSLVSPIKFPDAIQNLFYAEEVINPLFHFLEVPEIIQCSLVCRKWCKQSQQNSLWKIFFDRVCPGRGESLKPNSFKEAFIQFYLNLKNGIYSSHTFPYDLQFCPAYICADKQFLCAAKSSWKKVRVWKLPEETIQKTFTISENEKEYISQIHLYQGILYVGFGQGRIEAWDLKTTTCIKTFAGHEDETGIDREVLSLAIADQKLYSTHEGGRKKIWDLITTECISNENTMTAEKDFINSKTNNHCRHLACDGKYFYEGFTNGTISFKNLKMQNEKIFKGYVKPNEEQTMRGDHDWPYPFESLVSTGGILYANSSYTGIRIWDFLTKGVPDPSSPMKILQRESNPPFGQIAATNGSLYILSINDPYNGAHQIIVRDFCAPPDKVLKEIADLFIEDDYFFTYYARQRFKRLPTEMINDVFEEYSLLITKKYYIKRPYEYQLSKVRFYNYLNLNLYFEQYIKISLKYDSICRDISQAIMNYLPESNIDAFK